MPPKEIPLPPINQALEPKTLSYYLMNDIDPAKMTEDERKALFASFAKGIAPSSPPRQTVTSQLAPWVSSIQEQRDAGYDWKQIAQMCAANLKIKVSAKMLQHIVRAANESADSAARRRRRSPKANAAAPTNPSALSSAGSGAAPTK